MFAWIKRWLASFKWPADPNFKQRPQSDVKFGNWVLVEMGANDYSVLVDLLSQIQLSEEDIETRGRQIIGLRYMALAMSARTKSGKIPLNWQVESDLMWLGTLPYSEISPALVAVANLSDIPWLSPTFVDDATPSDVEVIQPSEEELEQNPS